MRLATCHPDRKHRAKGLCVQCASAAYYASHKEERRTYYMAHREERRTKSRAYDAARKEKEKGARLVRYAADMDEHEAGVIDRGRRRRIALRLETFNAYGGPRCVCCGETLFEGLSIDHIHGDGANHRRGTGGGNRIYSWLKTMNYPPGYQVLCYTCNMAKGTGDHCPHQDSRI